MISKQAIGKVCIAPRGQYDSSTQYYALDLVTYGGGSYLAIKDCIGIIPGNISCWQLIASGGAGAASVDSKGIMYWE